MREWFATDRAPNAFRAMCRRRDGLAFWGYWKGVFADRTLDRTTKEMLLYATAVSTRSAYGVPFAFGLLRRRGLDDETLLELLFVIRHFNGLTKVADLLQLESELTDEEISATRAVAGP